MTPIYDCELFHFIGLCCRGNDAYGNRITGSEILLIKEFKFDNGLYLLARKHGWIEVKSFCVRFTNVRIRDHSGNLRKPEGIESYISSQIVHKKILITNELVHVISNLFLCDHESF